MYGGYLFFFSRTEQHSSNEELLNGSIWTSREENWDRIPGFKALRSTYIYKSGNIYFTGGTLLIVSNAQLPAPAADIYF
jgi:hypothetical protein